MAHWNMTTRRGDRGLHVYIGTLKIAAIRFHRAGSKVVGLYLLDEAPEAHPTMSQALKEVHRRLAEAPPPEDAG